jgi:hypothetical protein
MAEKDLLNQEITENPISSGMNDLADSLNPELMFISTRLLAKLILFILSNYYNVWINFLNFNSY